MEFASDAAMSYTVDRENQITWVSERWWPFARDNNAPQLDPENVLGKNLPDFISDLTSRQLYEQLMGRVRNERRIILINIRCDSPDKKRFLKIKMSPLPEASVSFESWPVKEKTRPPISCLIPSDRHSDATVYMCSWCKCVLVGKSWMEIEDALPELGLLEMKHPPSISHCICNPCYLKVSQLI